MKSICYLLIVCLVFSCSSSKSTTTGIPGKKTLKGTWQVTNIRFVGDKGLYKAFLFDAADSACFNGSEWVFIPNNGSGKFTTAASTSQCSADSYRIHWSFYDETEGVTQFQFKYVDDKNKPTDAGNRGYRATIDKLDESSMEMRVPTTYEGNPFDVVMTFSKTSDDISL
ncbi:lipocalin family protein [Mangrovimonas aestuarii]|uniref:lipocalin family protein n=1 Tax=Mangrovimonas aestuarii TaxID=3018443 RepID=UPI0023786D85|nr:lipocalin family protein [Mangrovimonas aestuarii]